MLKMYRQILDGFALQSLIKSPNIPDFHLMVGSAECLDGLPLLVYKNAKVPNEIVENMKRKQNMTNEDIESAIANNQMEVNDLNLNTVFIGSGLGG